MNRDEIIKQIIRECYIKAICAYQEKKNKVKTK